MITGMVNAKKVYESGRLDAEFHLRGRRLKAVCTKRHYAVEVTVDEFLSIEARDKKAEYGDTLIARLKKLGVHDIEYNGHFGAHIFFSIFAEHDKPTRETGKPGLRQRACNVIRDYINEAGT